MTDLQAFDLSSIAACQSAERSVTSQVPTGGGGHG